MTYSKFNKEKRANIKMGQFYDNQTILQESEALVKEENKDLDINMLRESMSHYAKAETSKVNNVIKKQKYLNESNWYALKSYITRLAVAQANSLYDLKSIKEEFGIDPEAEIEQEIEDTLKAEIPLNIQGDMGTIIPIKIEMTPETADVVNTVLKLMDQSIGADKSQVETEQIEAAAKDAVNEIPDDAEEIVRATDEITDETIGIISKDQEILAGIKDKMDELESRVSENEMVLGLAGEEEYTELDPLSAGSEVEDRLVLDPETGLLVDPETGDLYDAKTGELIKEELHREYKIKTVIEALAYNKASKVLKENYSAYNREAAIVGGINSLIVLEAMDYVFGRKTSYIDLKKKLYIR